MGIVFLILASSRKWISGLFGTTGHTGMQWRAMLEQLLVFNIKGWSVDAAVPAVPFSALLQDTQILPGEPVLLVLLMLLLTYHHCFCSGDEQEILDRDFWGCTLTRAHCQSCKGMTSAAECRCGLYTQGPHLHSGFSKPVVAQDVSQVCSLRISQLCQCS